MEGFFKILNLYIVRRKFCLIKNILNKINRYIIEGRKIIVFLKIV